MHDGRRKLANSAARDIASPAVKMGNKGLFPGVAVPLAFFCTLFFRHRKKSVSAPWDGKSQFAPESARQAPPGGRGLRLRAHWGLSSGQTIGAARTVVRSACCLPELRVANRLRRLYPLDTRFPSFPPAPLRGLGASPHPLFLSRKESFPWFKSLPR